MGRKPGFTRGPLATAKQKRTMHLNALDRITKQHVAEMRKREQIIRELDQEIETLEKAENQ